MTAWTHMIQTHANTARSKLLQLSLLMACAAAWAKERKQRCKGRCSAEHKEEEEVLAEAAAQTTTDPAAKVTPHLSPARCPAEPSDLSTGCQNPAPGSLLTLTDVEEPLHTSNPLFYVCSDLAIPVIQTDSEREISNSSTCHKENLSRREIPRADKSNFFFPTDGLRCWRAIFFCSREEIVTEVNTTTP